MPETDLKKKNRTELLEMLVKQGKKLEELQGQLDKANADLADRAIKIEKAGTMAEASFMLNGVLEAVDAAARQYIENIKLAAGKQGAEAQGVQDTTEKQAEAIIADARRRAENILTEAKNRANAIISSAEKEREQGMTEVNSYLEQINAKLREYYRTYPGLQDYMEQTEEADK